MPNRTNTEYDKSLHEMDKAKEHKASSTDEVREEKPVF
jgi:hypothetical protein